MSKILLTGGGTAGHVTPNIALLPYLREAGFEIEYMGSYNGIEKRLIEKEGIPYTGISSGKLRRYFDLKNVSDPFRILKGYSEAKKYIKRFNPDIVFSKGGFVSVPVIYAAADLNIPIVIHESDLTPGLANKLSIRKASKICYTFPETIDFIPSNKAIHTGLPVRQSLLCGNPHTGYELCGFSEDKPLLMVIGGSLGAACINETVRLALDELLKTFHIAHICGKDKVNTEYEGIDGYKQFEYVGDELPDLFAAASLVISRAGSNVIHELLALKKPSLLIPLGTNQSRGDQILNAKSFKKCGYAENLFEDELSRESLINDVLEVTANRTSYIDAMSKADELFAAHKVVDVIMDVLGK